MITDIYYDERFDDDYNNTTTFYFVAPKEMLNEYIPDANYPDAISMEIAIEVPTNNIEAQAAGVSVSPTRKEEWGMEDYDWIDVNMPYDLIETLFVLADV